MSITTTYVNPRHELHYFIADIDDLSEELRSNNNLAFVHSIKKYSIVGVTSFIYENYIQGNSFTEISSSDALMAHKYASEVRTKHSEYVRDVETNQTTKQYVGVSSAGLEQALGVMKIIAKKLNVDYYENAPDQSDTIYGNPVLTEINNATTMGEMNIIYENYFHVDMPKTQAEALNLYGENYTRTYQPGKVSTDYLFG